MPTIRGIAEMALSVDDLDRSTQFYRTVLGFGPSMIGDDRMHTLSIPGVQVLLLFKKGDSTQLTPMPGGAIPPQDCDGHLHLAFHMDISAMDEWK